MPHFNQKDQRILKLWERGIKNKADIARKIGYNAGSLDQGVQRVEEGLQRLGIDPNPSQLTTNKPLC